MHVGQLATCGRLAIGPFVTVMRFCGISGRPIDNRPQVANLPYMLTQVPHACAATIACHTLRRT